MKQKNFTTEEVIVLLKAFHLDSNDGKYSKKLLNWCNNWIDYHIKEEIDYNTYLKNINSDSNNLNLEDNVSQFKVGDWVAIKEKHRHPDFNYDIVQIKDIDTVTDKFNLRILTQTPYATSKNLRLQPLICNDKFFRHATKEEICKATTPIEITVLANLKKQFHNINIGSWIRFYKKRIYKVVDLILSIDNQLTIVYAKENNNFKSSWTIFDDEDKNNIEVFNSDEELLDKLVKESGLKIGDVVSCPNTTTTISNKITSFSLFKQNTSASSSCEQYYDKINQPFLIVNWGVMASPADEIILGTNDNNVAQKYKNCNSCSRNWNKYDPICKTCENDSNYHMHPILANIMNQNSQYEVAKKITHLTFAGKQVIITKDKIMCESIIGTPDELLNIIQAPVKPHYSHYNGGKPFGSVKQTDYTCNGVTCFKNWREAMNTITIGCLTGKYHELTKIYNTWVEYFDRNRTFQ